MSAPIKITYDLKPPAGIQSNGLSASKTLEFAVPASPEAGQKLYYTALQATIAKARDQVGNDLTTWRDAVGKAELTKEPKQVKPEEEEEEEEGEEQ
ncbi:hypothetical protein P691DRAFT_307073 [Macrolepiota fuliginosa MF-IS2]|uniref:EKC/KEOPS complex subunit GON7 n=1 Tax=Macrolepiota fuliginosa MF-IS2 TaxID=1400762 RepID=A0A9P6BYX5_9AGAR|nr:hypothetical protein P691DRAFT_307073 [Macrolepiota fuliginosa MF-IS2]